MIDAHNNKSIRLTTNDLKRIKQKMSDLLKGKYKKL
jgi:hypothetical protein